MVPHRRTSQNRWNPDYLVDLRRCHTGTGFEGRHFGKNRHVDYFVKGVRRFGVLKALLCRRLKTELPPPSFEGELMESIVWGLGRFGFCSSPPPSFEGELMESFYSIICGQRMLKSPPPSFEGELMERLKREKEFVELSPTTFVWRRTNGKSVHPTKSTASVTHHLRLKEN